VLITCSTSVVSECNANLIEEDQRSRTIIPHSGLVSKVMFELHITNVNFMNSHHRGNKSFKARKAYRGYNTILLNR